MLTTDNDLVCEEIIFSRIGPDRAVPTSLMSGTFDSTKPPVDSDLASIEEPQDNSSVRKKSHSMEELVAMVSKQHFSGNEDPASTENVVRTAPNSSGRGGRGSANRRSSTSSRALTFSESGTPTGQNQYSFDQSTPGSRNERRLSVQEDRRNRRRSGHSNVTDNQVNAGLAAMRIFEQVTTETETNDQSPSNRSNQSNKSEWHESQGSPTDSMKCAFEEAFSKTPFYLMKTGTCMRTFHIAQVSIHRDIVRGSDIQPKKLSP